MAEGDRGYNIRAGATDGRISESYDRITGQVTYTHSNALNGEAVDKLQLVGIINGAKVGESPVYVFAGNEKGKQVVYTSSESLKLGKDEPGIWSLDKVDSADVGNVIKNINSYLGAPPQNPNMPGAMPGGAPYAAASPAGAATPGGFQWMPQQGQQSSPQGVISFSPGAATNIPGNTVMGGSQSGYSLDKHKDSGYVSVIDPAGNLYGSKVIKGADGKSYVQLKDGNRNFVNAYLEVEKGKGKDATYSTTGKFKSADADFFDSTGKKGSGGLSNSGTSDWSKIKGELETYDNGQIGFLVESEDGVKQQVIGDVLEHALSKQKFIQRPDGLYNMVKEKDGKYSTVGQGMMLDSSYLSAIEGGDGGGSGGKSGKMDYKAKDIRDVTILNDGTVQMEIQTGKGDKKKTDLVDGMLRYRQTKSGGYEMYVVPIDKDGNEIEGKAIALKEKNGEYQVDTKRGIMNMTDRMYSGSSSDAAKIAEYGYMPRSGFLGKVRDKWNNLRKGPNAGPQPINTTGRGGAGGTGGAGGSGPGPRVRANDGTYAGWIYNHLPDYAGKVAAVGAAAVVGGTVLAVGAPLIGVGLAGGVLGTAATITGTAVSAGIGYYGAKFVRSVYQSVSGSTGEVVRENMVRGRQNTTTQGAGATQHTRFYRSGVTATRGVDARTGRTASHAGAPRGGEP